jgi:type IX secretion system substrate protein
MKKIYLFAFLLFSCFAGSAQVTATLYPAGGLGTYSTGNCDGTTRNDDVIISGNIPTVEDGYAVFDLSTIPAGATITQVIFGFYVTTYGGAGTPSAWDTYGYPGDLSGVTVPATLFSDFTTFPAVSISTATYGTSTGNQTLPSTAGMVNFVAANIGSKVSIALTGGGTRTYTIKGESGVASTSLANHAPYLQVLYCPKPTSVTATATPNPVCTGATLTLNGTGIGGSGLVSFTWNGPGGYTGAGPTATTVASLASAGVYSLTVTNTCAGVYTATASATTLAVSVNPSPAAIIGNNAVCTSGSTTTLLSDPTPGGNWTSAITTIATISTGGLVTGFTVGSTNIKYTIPGTGCFAILPMTVNAPPGAITGTTSAMCQGNTTTLTETSITGVWGTTNTTVASVLGGLVTGGTGSGPVTILYTVPGCLSATYPMTINPNPGPITTNTGAFDVCIGLTSPTIMSDALGGGSWTASNTDAAFGTFGFTKNYLYGGTAGIDTVTYTITATGCFTTATVNVQTGPPAITGPSVVCEGQTIVLSDAFLGGGGWTSGALTVASVGGGTGVVTGVSGGIANITFTPFSTTCYSVQKVTVNSAPSAINYPGGAPTFCQNDSMLLSDPDPLGKWTSSNTLNAVVDSSSGLVKGVGVGGGVSVSANITYTFPSSGCFSILPVTVFPSPPDNITASGPTVFCSGGSVTLSVPSVGGSTYQWFNGGVVIPSATANTYGTSSTAALSVEVINSFGCIATSAPTLVIAGISPSIDTAGPLKFCSGSDVILKANKNGAVGIITYQWQHNGTNIPSAVLPNYPAGTTGNYTCIVTVSSGGSGSCSAATQTVSVTASPLPTPALTFTRNPGSTTFSTGTGYKSYQWYINSVAIPGANYYSYTANVNGSYRVWVTDTTDCGGYSSADVINDVSVPQVNLDDVKIFPNPATSVVHIESPVSVRAIVTGVEGKIIFDEANASEINIGSLAAGMYIIMLYDDNGERLKVEKLIKQ